MKSYSNKVEGTAALKLGANADHKTRIIDFEYAQRSRYTSSSICNTRLSSRRTIAQRIENSVIATPFVEQGEQRSSLVVVNRKSVAIYTAAITALFVICTLLFA